MCENITNLSDLIKTYYNEYNLFQNAKISYIKTLSEQEKIFFICEEQKNSVNIILHTKETHNDNTEDFDLTGSPLKDECTFDILKENTIVEMFEENNLWSQEEENYKGIPTKMAYNILNQVVRNVAPITLNAPLWVLCDGSDCEKTILIMFENNNTWNIRGISHFLGTILPNSINIKDIIRKHRLNMFGNPKVETSICNYFIINPNITVKLSWKAFSMEPSLNNAKNYDVVLQQKIQIDNNHSDTNHFWRQLLILSMIKGDIMTYKNRNDEKIEPSYSCGSGIDLETLRKKVFSIMTEVSETSEWEFSGTENSEIEAVLDKAKKRTPLDITDKLWELLKYCSSYKDLKTAFSYVFHCAAKCNIVNMPTNENHLAEIIREVSQGRLAIPHLSETEPLELLLEIGIEKLTKEYEYIITESKICGVKELQINQFKNSEVATEPQKTVRKSLHNALQNASHGIQRKTLLHTNDAKENTLLDIGFQNSKFNQSEIDYKLAKLGQIHLILEHLLIIQIHLNLDNVCREISTELLRRKPKSFNSLKNTEYDYLEISITTDKILHQLENKNPSARKITMQSENKFKKVETTFYYTTQSILPSNVFDSIEINETKISKDVVYYLYEFSKYYTRKSI